jgi:hypothetical protein
MFSPNFFGGNILETITSVPGQPTKREEKNCRIKSPKISLQIEAARASG